MKRLTVGILAHVDAGKTTLSEAFLYLSGSIRKLGRVDRRDTVLDTYELERRRGITIFSKQAVFTYNDAEITLIDTPGHADFSPEAERTLGVLDAAILVVSASAGVQSHTETIWQLLARHKIPTFIFINKTDLHNAGKDELMASLKKKLSPACIDGEALSDAEECAMCSETLMNSFLEKGTLTRQEISSEISRRRIFPCFFGSALKLDGVEEFLTSFTVYANEPERMSAFGAKVFKVTHDGDRLAHIKVTGGALHVKDAVTITDVKGQKFCQKVNQIRVYSGDKFTVRDQAPAGSVCAVTGLSEAKCLCSLGDEPPQSAASLEPILSYRLLPPSGVSAHKCFELLKTIEEEEPTLHASFNAESEEIHVLLMGEIQLEVLKHILKDRFGLDADFGEGSIMYRETIAEMCEGVGHFEPLKHYAEVHLLLEPTERGSGLSFFADCDEGVLSKNWQRLVLTHLEEKTHVGVLTGSPITDMKITLVSGKAHKKHTEGGDFREATYRAVRQGLRKAESILLEPWYSFEIRIPSEYSGRAMTDLQRFGASFGPPDIDGDSAVLTGSAPASELRYYSLDIASYTHGKGSVNYTLCGYEPCHNADDVIQKIGYNPDADAYNPCGSVFCANGAGFNVPWYETESYMHLESVLENADSAEEKAALKQRAENYCKAVAADKELMEIFERTYGKIKPRTAPEVKFNPSAAQPKPKAAPKKAAKTYDGEEYLLIDGYNIIFAWDELKTLAAQSLESARNELINRLCNYQGFCKSNIILVFDAYRVNKNPGTVEKFRNICVVYTREAETADTYIERTSSELSKNHRVRVATSDGPEQMIILGNGALRVPAAAFRKELTDAENAIREIIEQFS